MSVLAKIFKSLHVRSPDFKIKPRRELHCGEVEKKWVPTNLHSLPEQRIVESAICLAGFQKSYELLSAWSPVICVRVSMQKLVFPYLTTKDKAR